MVKKTELQKRTADNKDVLERTNTEGRIKPEHQYLAAYKTLLEVFKHRGVHDMELLDETSKIAISRAVEEFLFSTVQVAVLALEQGRMGAQPEETEDEA